MTRSIFRPVPASYLGRDRRQAEVSLARVINRFLPDNHALQAYFNREMMLRRLANGKKKVKRR